MARKTQRIDIASRAEMLLVDTGGKVLTRQMEVKTKLIDGRWRTHIKFVFPPDIAGTQLLVLETAPLVENDMFFYQTLTKRTRRVSAAQRGGRFVGSDFSYEDLDIRKVDDDEHATVRDEELVLTAGSRTLRLPSTVVRSVPKPSTRSAYSSFLTWIEKKTNFPRQIESFIGTEVVKRLRVLALESSKGRLIPMLSEMQDLRSKTKTIVRTTGYSLDRDAIPDSLFSESALLSGG
jgi:hypothetical protein